MKPNAATEERRELGWIDWPGGKCPVAGDQLVQVKYRPLHSSLQPGVSQPAAASWFAIGSFDWWRHESVNRSNDIIAYRQVCP